MGLIREARVARGWLKKAEALVRSDKEVARDIDLFLIEADQRIKIAAAHPAATAELKEAFNNVAGLLPVGHKFVRKGKLTFPSMMRMATKRRKLEKSVVTLSDAFNAGNPAMVGLSAFILTNRNLRRVLAKTNGVFYSLQDKPDGSGAVNMLLPVPAGFPGSVPLKPVEYAGLKIMLKFATWQPKGPTR